MRSALYTLAAVAITITACDTDDPAPATPAMVTREEFKQIGWIAGNWRGSGSGSAPFFESYRMVDDSTLMGITWKDASFTIPQDTSMIRWRNGEVTHGTDAVATRWSANSVHFDPRGKVMNSYTWKQETNDRWTAHLRWTGQAGTPRERTYVLERVAE